MTFTGYILCFGATTSHDLVTLTFDLLTFRVAKWVVDANITREDCNRLLDILRKHGHYLPKDRRTLLSITPQSVNVVNKCGGQYVACEKACMLLFATVCTAVMT